MNNKLTIPMEDYPKIKLKSPSIRGKAEIELVEKRNELISQIAQTIFTDHIKQTNIIQLIKDNGFDVELTAEEILTLKLFQRALSREKRRLDAFRIIRYLAGESNMKKVNIRKLMKR